MALDKIEIIMHKISTKPAQQLTPLPQCWSDLNSIYNVNVRLTLAESNLLSSYTSQHYINWAYCKEIKTLLNLPKLLSFFIKYKNLPIRILQVKIRRLRR